MLSCVPLPNQLIGSRPVFFFFFCCGPSCRDNFCSRHFPEALKRILSSASPSVSLTLSISLALSTIYISGFVFALFPVFLSAGYHLCSLRYTASISPADPANARAALRPAASFSQTLADAFFSEQTHPESSIPADFPMSSPPPPKGESLNDYEFTFEVGEKNLLPPKGPSHVDFLSVRRPSLFLSFSFSCLSLSLSHVPLTVNQTTANVP